MMTLENSILIVTRVIMKFCKLRETHYILYNKKRFAIKNTVGHFFISLGIIGLDVNG